MLRSSWSSMIAPVARNRKVATPSTRPTTPESKCPALAIMASSAAPVWPPTSPPSSSTIAPCAASRLNASPATAIATSSIGASEKTVKKAIAAPRLMARSFHHPASAVLNSPPMMRLGLAEWSLPPRHFGRSAIPATRAVAVNFVSSLRHRNSVLQLDEAATRMLQRRLDRKHHARLERKARIFGLIGIARSVREPRRFMTHQPNAVYKEVEVIGTSGFVHHLQPGLVNLGPDRTGLNSPHGSTLCHLDLGQHVFELGIRVALDGHAADITDIAVEIPTGINRHEFPVLPLLRRGGAIEALPRGDQAIFEEKTAIGLLTPQRIDDLLLGHAGAMPLNHGKHAVDDEVCRQPQLAQFIWRLAGAQSLQHQKRIDDLGVRE